MFRRTNRALGSSFAESEPEVIYGRSEEGTPTVLIKGGHLYRRAPGIAFSNLSDLKRLRRDLDEAIDLMTISAREGRDV